MEEKKLKPEFEFSSTKYVELIESVRKNDDFLTNGEQQFESWLELKRTVYGTYIIRMFGGLSCEIDNQRELDFLAKQLVVLYEKLLKRIDKGEHMK